MSTYTPTLGSAPATPVITSGTKGRLGSGLLVALVLGSILGSGIFGLPQNMAAGAGAGAILLGWLITGAGMLTLALVYQMIALRKPDLNNGIYAYARATAGDYVGFNSAWGYWVSAWIGTVGYLVAAFAALGYFFPAFGPSGPSTPQARRTVSAVTAAGTCPRTAMCFVALWLLPHLYACCACSRSNGCSRRVRS
nr:amino acid permease [Methylibium sp.]